MALLGINLYFTELLSIITLTIPNPKSNSTVSSFDNCACSMASDKTQVILSNNLFIANSFTVVKVAKSCFTSITTYLTP